MAAQQTEEEPAGEPQEPPVRADDLRTPLDTLVRRTSSSRNAGWPTGALRVMSLARGSVAKPAAVAVLAFAVVVGWAAWHWLARPAPIEDRMPVAPGSVTGTEPATSVDTASTDQPADSEPDGSVASVGEGRIIVHVAGAVALPGLTELPAGARVGEALEAAGGGLPEADPGQLNLAAVLGDGARVYVPVIGEEVAGPLVAGAPEGGSGEPGRPAPVDINSADTKALEKLPGIGPATAEAIITHRERNGAFRRVEALMEVRGIGEAKLEALEGLVSVG